MFEKIKNKKAGAGMMVVLIACIITFVGIFPAIIDSSAMHIASKKIKGYSYNASNSAALVIPEIKQEGSVVYHLDKGAEAVKKIMNTTFGESFYTTELNTSIPSIYSDKLESYYKQTYTTYDKKIAVEYIAYVPKNETTRIKTPIKSEINTNILHNANDEDITYQISGINKEPSFYQETQIDGRATVLVIIRYDLKTFLEKEDKSIVRIASSEVNLHRLDYEN